VSRAGVKLDHALREFSLDVRGLICADFGCNVGGFTDCLLKRGAGRVYALDTGYGVLAYALRVDPRVVVMERTNALHAEPPEPVDVVVIDLAWTPQRHALPAARRWLRPQRSSRVVTLVKPHYELDETEKTLLLTEGVLDPSEARRVLDRVMAQTPGWGFKPAQWTQSPITGGKSGKRRGKPRAAGEIGPGNIEFLVLLEPLQEP
jgi:23S rRNA (cytidine1920-2'-O)/16S rRNA (cytidine1409-2'-O)-methyltransferase